MIFQFFSHVWLPEGNPSLAKHGEAHGAEVRTTLVASTTWHFFWGWWKRRCWTYPPAINHGNRLDRKNMGIHLINGGSFHCPAWWPTGRWSLAKPQPSPSHLARSQMVSVGALERSSGFLSSHDPMYSSVVPDTSWAPAQARSSDSLGLAEISSWSQVGLAWTPLWVKVWNWVHLGCVDKVHTSP